MPLKLTRGPMTSVDWGRFESSTVQTRRRRRPCREVQPRILRTAEAARYLGVSPWTVRRLVADGSLHYLPGKFPGSIAKSSITTSSAKRSERKGDNMRGDGSLFKRHTNSCTETEKPRAERADTCKCPWWMSYRANGRGYSESCSTSNKTVAKARLKAKIREINSGKFVEPSVQKITVDELVEDLKAWYRAGLSPRTFNPERFLADVDSRWTLHLQPFFGGRKANMVTASLMRDYRNKRLAEKASNVTVNREIQVLRKAYRLAASSEPPKIQRLPQFEFAREDNARKVQFDAETKSKMLLAASKEGLWAKVWLSLAFEFGLRRSDLRRLTVGQFNLVEGFLSHTVSKTRQPVQLSLRPDLVLLVRELTRGKRPGERLFPVQDFRYAWKRICKAAGITAGKKNGFVLHDARRTTTQELVSSGAAARDIIAVLGWKSPAMLHRYGYAEAGSIKTALERRAAHQQTLATEGEA